MKNYKKATLATMVLATMPLLAATSTTPIKVTTFADEDGENTNACSLREALTTAELRKSYGGCAVTDTLSTTTKVIQLEEGTYLLDRELTPKVDVVILGKSPVDWQKKSVLTNNYPSQTALKTKIEAKNNSRIFNTTLANKSLTLNSIALNKGTTSDRGGAIYAGANVSLINSQILNSSAGVSGGAVFLAGPTSGITITNSLIEKNKAPLGSVLGMSCFNDNVYSKHEINFIYSSLISNGDAQSTSMLDFCGEPVIKLEANTIASNIASTVNGSLIKFTGDTKSGGTTGNTSTILSDRSSLTMLSNTIVENTAYSTFLYDALGLKQLDFNILAFNTGGLACRYLLGDATELENIKIGLNYNAIALNGNNKCDLPKIELKEEGSDKHTNLDVSANSISQLLTARRTPSEYTAFLPIYYPRLGVVGEEKDLVDVAKEGADACSTVDQRGIARITNGTLYFDPNARNSCDIGSVELMKFTAGDLEDLSNTSLTDIVKLYQQQVDKYEFLVKNPDDPNLTTSDKEQLERFKNLLAKTKDNIHYRAIYIDLKNYQLPLPQEVEDGNGNNKLIFFNKDLYNVQTEVLGTGQIKDLEENQDKEEVKKEKEKIVCQWNQDLEQIILYRKDDQITQAGDKVHCKYTISSKPESGMNVQSSGLIKAAFVNIAPVVKDTSVTLRYQKQDKVALNLLNFANDWGDTGEGGKGPDNNINKPQFWKNADGVELPIRLSNLPGSNLIITSDRKGPCPVPDQKETCYGGNIYIEEGNTFNQFDYSFNYQVYDNDITPTLSNLGTVKVISTANTTDNKRNASRGGGSTTIFSLLGLMSLLVIRRFKK
ncbi:CSLREA domain-containing protein [Acinetobacter beijerinckii]|uniref:CSLREA domain-containing protein n=1 Tax=Acinetobacter beijerinckii CIP 110307 TaxID=1217648 RepID=N9F8R3_9GAMM|nr:CSLREA domain-containing protein [Acinetobacter beijerinckii]ENW03685.1 hypothetical protein F933_03085 [Acinetobacter beijerinckii CIP 110307]